MQHELLSRAVGDLTGAAAEAVATLRALLGPSTPASVRLGTARAVLEVGSRLREAERVAALEAALGVGP